MATMSDERLAAIKARLGKATPGGWHQFSGIVKPDYSPYGDWDHIGCDMRPEDAEFIAHAKADVPDLLAEVERLRALLRRWVHWLPGSVWECSQCGYIAITSPEDWSEFTRALLADTLAGLEASDGG